MKIPSKIFMLLSVVVMASCSSAVDLTATYTNPDSAQQTYQNFFISSAFAGDTARILLEEAVESELQEEGLSGLASHEIWAGNPQDFDLSSAVLVEILKDADKDAVLTVSVLAGDSQTRFVQREATYDPITMNPWYRSYDEYYDHYGAIVYNTGYYATGKEYFVEVNLFDVKTQKLIWSGQTSTYATADVVTVTENLADLIVDELEEQQLILDGES